MQVIVLFIVATVLMCELAIAVQPPPFANYTRPSRHPKDPSMNAKPPGIPFQGTQPHYTRDPKKTIQPAPVNPLQEEQNDANVFMNLAAILLAVFLATVLLML
jgi:hypothetical protein